MYSGMYNKQTTNIIDEIPGQSPSWEASSCQASKNIFLMLWVRLFIIVYYTRWTKSRYTIYSIVLLCTYFWPTRYVIPSRCQWPRGLRRRFAAARLPGLWVRVPPGAWMFVSCECCVLSGRVFCVGLIARPREYRRVWCDQWGWSRSPVRGGHDPTSGRSDSGKKSNK